MWYNIESLPIVVRHRKNGDKIRCGGNTKKIKDLFIDEKVPKSVRDEALLACKDDEILMVFGFRKSDILKNSKNKNIKISVMEENNG